MNDNTESPDLTLVVLLFLHPDKRREFEEFEAAASSIMRRHGGRITHRIAAFGPAGEDQPDEVHVVNFPDEDSFSRYRSDPELARLSDLRLSSIRKTTIWRGKQLPPWVG